MGLTKPYLIRRSGGEVFRINLVECVNVTRTPQIRQQILDGTFHRVYSEERKGWISVEKKFFYSDFERHHYFLVKPRNDRHQWKDASAELERFMKDIPPGLVPPARRHIRVVFGLGELREKLVGHDSGFDDRIVEMMKVYLVSEHPFLLKRARLRIYLDRVTSDYVHFMACYDHNEQRFRVSLPAVTAKKITGNKKQLQELVRKNHKRSDIFALVDDHWVNMWRWSPSNVSLDQLKTFAARIRRKESVNETAKEFVSMLKYLPRGSQLPSWAKQDLKTIFEWAKKNHKNKLQDRLFEIRFDRELDDDWYLNRDPDDIDSLWKLLKDLPDANVEGNTALHEIQLDKGEGGGTYYPDSHDIGIGDDELHSPERFQDVLRHEVGHAVHEQKKRLVDDWLRTEYGWKMYDPTPAGIDDWIEDMGGWGKTIRAEEKSQIRELLRKAAGKGSTWDAAKVPEAPAKHPWNGDKFGPRLAVENSVDRSKEDSSWYENTKNWYRFGDKAFFINYWYGTLCVVNTATIKFISQMPDAYAAMSPLEFFAELYALYYDLDDPKRKNIPDRAMAWLEKNIGRPEKSRGETVAAPAKPLPKKAKKPARKPAGKRGRK